MLANVYTDLTIVGLCLAFISFIMLKERARRRRG